LATGIDVFLSEQQQPCLRGALGPKTDSRVLLIGSEDATDPAIHELLVNG
jgi:hypothetical protein